MTANANTDELPVPVLQFIRDLEGALGDQLIGATVFGSWANGRRDPNRSDLDVAVIVGDAAGEQNREGVFRVLSTNPLVDRSSFSLSVESYIRLKEFLRLGDPFAWVVCSEGVIVKDRSGLLSDLQRQCRSVQESVDAAAASGYLHEKSRTHYALAMQAFQEFLANIQLSVMAGAQAVAAQRSQGRLNSKTLADMARWDHLKEKLSQAGATAQEVESIEQLVVAHKLARTETEYFAGKEAIDLVRRAGQLWRKLMPEGPSGQG